ncbi:MAG: DUF1330 domain-containing protein [Rhodobacteraceae bacterium]|nr:DUF1330 domain-containing protein [Paracoccaceae bacterium]
MTVYTIASIEVTDPDAYAEYARLSGAAVARFGGKFLVRGGTYEVMEGHARSRNVIIEWPDMATAKAFYNSPDYQRALAHGLPAARRDYIFVEGV